MLVSWLTWHASLFHDNGMLWLAAFPPKPIYNLFDFDLHKQETSAQFVISCSVSEKPEKRLMPWTGKIMDGSVLPMHVWRVKRLLAEE